MMRKSNGKLHYYINGVDQGVATDKVEQQVWGVIDLYGMTVKVYKSYIIIIPILFELLNVKTIANFLLQVSIVDPCEDIDSNINNVPHTSNDSPDTPAISKLNKNIHTLSTFSFQIDKNNLITSYMS